jgi:ankyrin repeat protein
MPRQLTAATNLDNLRKEAKRWLKALLANDADARERFQTANPDAPGTIGLRSVQHALAREYGMAGWKELTLAVPKNAAPAVDANPVPPEIIARFLECACPDHHVRGGSAHRMARHDADRFLAQNPGIARHDLYTAVVCGEIDEIERILRTHPELANTKHAASGPDRSGGGNNFDFLENLGAKNWEPLLYLCFTRLDSAKSNDNAIAIARLLLDHGADPNAYFMAGDSRYTPLTGVIGEGEEDRPPHPHRDELARLLLERGAEPYDTQVMYNIHSHGKALWWIKLVHEFSLRAGRAADWADPDWRMLDMGNYGCGARYLLNIAIYKSNRELAEWCLAHGANPNAVMPPPKRPEIAGRVPSLSPYALARRNGELEIAEILARYGAVREEVPISEGEKYDAACFRLDRTEAELILGEHPEFRQSSGALFRATMLDRADAVAFILDLGTPIEIEGGHGQTALHVAAQNDALNVARLLIERGAEIDPYDRGFSSTPIDFAVYRNSQPMIDVLRPYSYDVWSLAPIGDVDRLRTILAEQPDLAKTTWQTTPLFWLPDDETRAVEIVRLFLEHGADPKFRSKKDGSTAADVARQRGMHDVAALLDAAAGGNPESGRREHLLAQYEQAARDLVTVYETDDEAALDRLGRQYNRILTFGMIRAQIRQRVEGRPRIELDEARRMIARYAGFEDWPVFLESLGGKPAKPLPHGAAEYAQLAQDWVSAYEEDAEALARMNRFYQRSYTLHDLKSEIWRRNYAFRQRSSRVPKNYLAPDEARMIVAQDAGFGSWDALLKAIETGTPPPPAFQIDEKENRARPYRRMSLDDWDEMIAAMKERRVTALDADGLFSDAVLKRITELEHVTRLRLGGSQEMTDEGLLQLARMPQLEYLDLGEYPGGRLTDRGLEVLKHLPNLKRFEMTWQAGVTDKGVANLKYCDQLEHVTLMGSPTGDGAIEALQGKPKLISFNTGRLVTDAGLPLLQNFPALATLLIDGSFTDAGLAGLAGIESIRDLDLFWHVTSITSDGFAHLARLPNLESLGCDGKLSDDTAMGHIGRMPRLRKLRAQESVATDAGFEALARSKTLEGFWGRVCQGFGSRAFRAFSKMASLRGMGVGLQDVDDESLAAFPDFPALRELTPIGLKDPGFRHVGQVKRLERLTCMYCRESGDAATEHIAGLELKYYYAGLTQITDRSLEILGRMSSLEKIELYECHHVTDAGLVFLARMPSLREAEFAGSPGITLEGTKVFPAGVRVAYTT